MRSKMQKKKQISAQCSEQVGIFFLAPERVPRKPLRYFDTLKHKLLRSSVLTKQDHQNGCVTSKKQAVKDWDAGSTICL